MGTPLMAGIGFSRLARILSAGIPLIVHANARLMSYAAFAQRWAPWVLVDSSA